MPTSAIRMLSGRHCRASGKNAHTSRNPLSNVSSTRIFPVHHPMSPNRVTMLVPTVRTAGYAEGGQILLVVKPPVNRPARALCFAPVAARTAASLHHGRYTMTIMTQTLQLAYRIAIVWSAGFLLAVAVRALLPDEMGTYLQCPPDQSLRALRPLGFLDLPVGRRYGHRHGGPPRHAHRHRLAFISLVT